MFHYLFTAIWDQGLKLYLRATNRYFPPMGIHRTVQTGTTMSKEYVLHDYRPDARDTDRDVPPMDIHRTVQTAATMSKLDVVLHDYRYYARVTNRYFPPMDIHRTVQTAATVTELDVVFAATILDLTCKYGMTLSELAWKTSGRTSKEATCLAYSRPTTVDAATTLRKFYFPCQGAVCARYPFHACFLFVIASC